MSEERASKWVTNYLMLKEREFFPNGIRSQIQSSPESFSELAFCSKDIRIVKDTV